LGEGRLPFMAGIYEVLHVLDRAVWRVDLFVVRDVITHINLAGVSAHEPEQLH